MANQRTRGNSIFFPPPPPGSLEGRLKLKHSPALFAAAVLCPWLMEVIHQARHQGGGERTGIVENIGKALASRLQLLCLWLLECQAVLRQFDTMVSITAFSLHPNQSSHSQLGLVIYYLIIPQQTTASLCLSLPPAKWEEVLT